MCVIFIVGCGREGKGEWVLIKLIYQLSIPSHQAGLHLIKQPYDQQLFDYWSPAARRAERPPFFYFRYQRHRLQRSTRLLFAALAPLFSRPLAFGNSVCAEMNGPLGILFSEFGKGASDFICLFLCEKHRLFVRVQGERGRGLYDKENIGRILCVLFISSWRSSWEQHGSKCAKLKAVAENIFSRVKYHMEKKYWKIDNVVKTYRTTPFICNLLWSDWSLKMHVGPRIWDKFALLAAGKLDFLVVIDLKYSSQN